MPFKSKTVYVRDNVVDINLVGIVSEMPASPTHGDTFIVDTTSMWEVEGVKMSVMVGDIFQWNRFSLTFEWLGTLASGNRFVVGGITTPSDDFENFKNDIVRYNGNGIVAENFVPVDVPIVHATSVTVAVNSSMFSSYEYRYDGITETWATSIPASTTGPGFIARTKLGKGIRLGDLADVKLSNLTTGDTLVYQSPVFVNTTPPVEPIDNPEVQTNTAPSPNAVRSDGTLKCGTGIDPQYATVVNDGVLDMAFIPTVNGPGGYSIGPSENGIYEVGPLQEGQDIGLVFALTLNAGGDIVGMYDVDVEVSNGVDSTTLRLDTRNGSPVFVAVDDPNYVIIDNFVDEVTIQQGTRVSFMVGAGLLPEVTDEHKLTITATNKRFAKTFALEGIVRIVDTLEDGGEGDDVVVE